MRWWRVLYLGYLVVVLALAPLRQPAFALSHETDTCGGLFGPVSVGSTQHRRSMGSNKAAPTVEDRNEYTPVCHISEPTPNPASFRLHIMHMYTKYALVYCNFNFLDHFVCIVRPICLPTASRTLPCRVATIPLSTFRYLPNLVHLCAVPVFEPAGSSTFDATVLVLRRLLALQSRHPGKGGCCGRGGGCGFYLLVLRLFDAQHKERPQSVGWGAGAALGRRCFRWRNICWLHAHPPAVRHPLQHLYHHREWRGQWGFVCPMVNIFTPSALLLVRALRRNQTTSGTLNATPCQTCYPRRKPSRPLIPAAVQNPT